MGQTRDHEMNCKHLDIFSSSMNGRYCMDCSQQCKICGKVDEDVVFAQATSPIVCPVSGSRYAEVLVLSLALFTQRYGNVPSLF